MSRKNRFVAVLLCVFLLVPVFIMSASALSVSAESAILIDAASGNIIYEKNSDVRMSMASTTKIMTAIVAIENYDLEKIVCVSPEAVGIEGSSVYLYAGEHLSMKNLIYALLLESANDAATAIAIAVAKNTDEFAGLMNRKAEDLGLANTHFTNPHGLDDPEHYTTARDLAMLTRYALGNEIFKEIVSTKKTTIPLNETEGVRLLVNHNKMLRFYDGAVGVKTGFTKKSGRCLVSAAERDGLTLIAVTLKAPNDWTDHKNMLDLGFGLYESITLNEANDYMHALPVVSGKAEYVMISNASPLTLTVKKGHGKISCTVELPRFIFASVAEGDVLGALVYYCDGEEIARVDLVAMYSVGKQEYKLTLWEKILSIFGR